MLVTGVTEVSHLVSLVPQVRFGGSYCVTLINSNADAHVFHLHGHTFASIETAARAAEPGAGQTQSPRRDSVVVPGGNCSRRTVCFVADNPAGGLACIHVYMYIYMNICIYIYI